MKSEDQQNNQIQQISKIWTKPEITVYSIIDETLGNAGFGGDNVEFS